MPKITDPALLAELNSPPPQTRVIGAPDPFKVRDQQRQDEAAALAARAADRQDANFQRQAKNDADRTALAREQLDFQKAQAEFQRKQNEKLSPLAGKRAQLEALSKQLDLVQSQLDQNFKGQNDRGIFEYLPTPANRTFDAAAAGLSEQALSAFRTPGIGSQSDAELRAFVTANQPGASQYDEVNQQRLDNIRLRLNEQLKTYQDQGDGIRDSGVTGSLPPAPQSSTKIGGTFNAGPSGALAAGSTADTPIPPQMQAEYDQFVAANRGRISPEDYAQFRIEQNQKYGFGFQPGDVQKYIDEGRRINDPANNINTNIPSPKRELGTGEAALTGFAGTGTGAALISYLNSAGFGVPGALAGDQKINAVQDESPVGSFVGDVAGGLTGTVGLAKGALALGAKSLPNALTAANLAYGGLTGAASDTENPLLGGASGLGVASLGQGVGQFALGPAFGKLATSRLGNGARGIFGARRLPATPTLSASERALTGAIGNDGRAIAQTFAEAQSLGVPMTLADANPALRSLAGATARRSPEAKALAEGVFEPRQVGQIDRLQAALNRNLGPGANIPETSDALLRQARATSGPLYEAAYAAPGASSVDASGVLNTPTGKEALKKAYRAILDDKGDPTGLGFDIDQAGEVVLNRTPSFQALDYVKRSFDDIAQSGERNPITGAPIGNQAQTSAANSARELRSAIDAVNPDYAAARAAYAGPVGEREALNAGKQFTRMTPDELKFAFDRLSESRRGQFKLGARSTLSDQADRVRLASNPFEALLGTPAAQQKVAMLFPDGAGNLIRQANLEKALAKSKNEILGNSLTAQRLIDDQAFGMSPGAAAMVDGASAVMAGAPPVATGGRLLAALSKDNLKMGIGKKRANELGPVLFDENRAIDSLKSATLKKRQSSILGRKARRRNRAVGSAVGAASTAPFLTSD